MKVFWTELRLWWCSCLLSWLTDTLPDPTPAQLRAVRELAWACLGGIDWDETDDV